jgi:hypothetical protein
VEAYLLEETSPPTLLVEWEDRGPLLVLQPDRIPSESWQLPPRAEPLRSTHDVMAELLDSLRSVELPARTRSTVMKALRSAAVSEDGVLTPRLLTPDQWADLTT